MKSLELNTFLEYRYLSSPEFAPGGQRAAFVVQKAEEESNSYSARLYLYDGTVRQLTDLGRESSFTWLDDQRLIFPAQRSEHEKKLQEAGVAFTSYYCLDLRGGEALPFMTLPFQALDLQVIDPEHFMVIGAFHKDMPDAYTLSEDDRKKLAEDRKKDTDYEVFDELPFWGNGRGVTNGRRTSLFHVSLNPFRIERLTSPEERVSDMTVLGSDVYYTVSPCQARRSLRGLEIRVWNCESCSGRTVLRHPDFLGGSLVKVGSQVWVLASDGSRYGLNENDSVYRLDAEHGRLELIRREEYDMYSSVGSDCRLGGGHQMQERCGCLYHITTREGSSHVFRLSPDGASEPVMELDGSVDAITVSDHAPCMLLVGMLDMHLQELYSWDLESGKLTQLTHFNDAVLQDVYVAQPRSMTIQSQGETIEGWVLLPQDFDPSRTYPAVLDIHGGPKTVYGPVFYHEMQLWASRGYIVFFCNPKGSDGRDNAFADIRGMYGTVDYDNIMDFTDAVLAAYPQIDPQRVCVTGGSYGGFMTNWIIGHTQRFCCAASQRSISNWLSFWGISDIGFYFAEDQNAANLYTSPEKLWDHSPLKYVRNARTPTLFIHSDEDYRCPEAEGIQMYASLVDLGVPARLCLFHGENHELSRSGKPLHRVRRLQEITDWFEQYAKTDQS